MDFKKRFRNKAFWVSLFALIALTGKMFNIYQVPDGWDNWVDMVLALLTMMGVIMDPTTSGVLDGDKPKEVKEDTTKKD